MDTVREKISSIDARFTLHSPDISEYEGRFGTDEDIRLASLQLITSVLERSPKAERMWDLLTTDPEVNTYLDMANFIAVGCLGMNDHGPVHAVVATASALTMLDLLMDAGVMPDCITSGMGTEDDARLVVLTAALLHDIGNLVHRADHITHSTHLASPILDRLLVEIYPGTGIRTRIKALILSAIYTHHGDPRPLTIEAALVCIGDATDMTNGRARAAYDQGSVTIHTVSALSIDTVSISGGDTFPVRISVGMSNPAGIYQVQEILAPKVDAGPLRKHVEIVAKICSYGKKENIESVCIREGISRIIAGDKP